MMSTEQDQQVTDFLVSFAQLKNFSDDDPLELMKLSLSDDSVVDLCTDIFQTYTDIKDRDDLNSSAYIHSISKAFISSYRDYENRFQWACLLVGLIGNKSESKNHVSKIMQYYFIDKDLYFKDCLRANSNFINRPAWEVANDDAVTAKAKIDNAIIISQLLVGWMEAYPALNESLFEVGGSDAIELIQSASDGSEIFRNLEVITDIDIQGIIRRKSLAPLILVQSKSSHGSHSSLQISLFSILNQAHKAFIFGLNFASISMLRSTLEVILRDHYKLGGTSRDGRPIDLLQMINDSYSKLPKAIGPIHLHKLRIKANSILHISPKDMEGESAVPIMALEIEVLEYLHTIRRLIEELR